MKIIEAMKRIKDNKIKLGDLQKLIGQYCTDLTIETTTYPDQPEQIRQWIQSFTDTVNDIENLKIAIQKTNIATQVTIQIGENKITKSIAGWVLRRRELAPLCFEMWGVIGDRGLKEGHWNNSSGVPQEVKIRRHFDPMLRDKMRALYRSEPSIIDGTLEVVNAVTELVS